MKMETMSLLGGKLSYGLGRFKSDESPRGRKVYFLGENGTDRQLEGASERMSKGQVLTVKEIFVNTFTSEVEFIEYPTLIFNTVMFADYEAPETEVAKIDKQPSSDFSELAEKVLKANELMKSVEDRNDALQTIGYNDIDLIVTGINLNAYLSSETLAEIKRLVIAELTGKIEHDTESLHELLKGGTGK